MTKFNVTLRGFASKILYFNGMYKLPISPIPSTKNLGVDVATRLRAFKQILIDEVNEVDDIILAIEKSGNELDTLTNIADWLGDLQIYCASEMAKFGIPLNDTLDIIMASNFSKLDSDGKPIINAMGKVEKGPLYYKPEPELKKMLENELNGE